MSEEIEPAKSKLEEGMRMNDIPESNPIIRIIVPIQENSNKATPFPEVPSFLITLTILLFLDIKDVFDFL